MDFSYCADRLRRAFTPKTPWENFPHPAYTKKSFPFGYAYILIYVYLGQNFNGESFLVSCTVKMCPMNLHLHKRSTHQEKTCVGFNQNASYGVYLPIAIGIIILCTIHLFRISTERMVRISRYSCLVKLSSSLCKWKMSRYLSCLLPTYVYFSLCTYNCMISE